MAHQPEAEETVSLVEALRVLYVRTAAIADLLPKTHPARFHLVKAAERIVSALRAQAGMQARRN